MPLTAVSNNSMCVCVCVCVCARACVCVVCVCVRERGGEKMDVVPLAPGPWCTANVK